MKKLIILSVVAALGFAACKKTPASVSTEVTQSFPTITFPGGIYYSIGVGGTLPTISATAYDSFYNEVDPVILDQSQLDANTPGLYVVSATSKNKYGFTSYASVYVAVTNIDPLINLTGTYERTSNSVLVHVSKLANGLYLTDNVGGVDPSVPTNASFILPAVFVQTDDTTIILPPQLTAQGTLYGSNASIIMAPADTAYSYKVINGAFGTSLRTFVKQ